MHTKQYTIRKIPNQLDDYLRRQAKISGKSLNQVIIDELSQNAGMDDRSLTESLDWFIGSKQIDQKVEDALTLEDKNQKTLMRQKWELDGNRH